MCALWLLTVVHHAQAQEEARTPEDEQAQQDTRTQEDDHGIFNFIFENDLFDGTDRGYTNGVR